MIETEVPEKFNVNEIFYSLQGEGYFTGTPAIFIRFSGCNMQCPFCDTTHQSGKSMTSTDIIDIIRKYPANHVVITGGEPSLQLTHSFVDMLHKAGYFIQIETNGTILAPDNVDWITCSPKSSNIAYTKVDELKVLFHGNIIDNHLETLMDGIRARHYYLQPCDVQDDAHNSRIMSECIGYIKAHPKWCLSIQTHKLLNIQ